MSETTYFFVSQLGKTASGKDSCLNVWGNSNFINGTNITTYSAENVDSQKWFIRAEDGHARVYSAAAPDKCLDFSRYTSSYANADIYSPVNNATDTLVEVYTINASDGTCRICQLDTGYYLTASGTADGANVTWAPATGKPNQIWKINKSLDFGDISSTGSSKNDDNEVAGLDTAAVCNATTCAEVSNAGRCFIGRYYCANDSSKLLTASEAKIIHNAGLKIISFYQDSNNQASYFNYSWGVNDAYNALARASQAGQTDGAIFFAVDYDATDSEIQNNIVPYFQGVAATIGSTYAIGIYGSGAVCRKIKDELHLADYAYLSMSSAFNGTESYRAEKNYSVKQIYNYLTFNGVTFDDATAVKSSGYGEW